MASKLPPAFHGAHDCPDEPADDRRIYDAPLHVMRGADGTVSVFFPDGHRMVLSAEAAERSGAILWRTAVVQRQGREARAALRSGKVIAVDFAARAARS